MNFISQKFLGINGKGESLPKILYYWLPELVSATILISLPPMIDSWIVSQLGSLTMYGALGLGVNFLHTSIKVAEAIPTAAIAVIGRHNGAKEYTECGKSLGDTFWTTFAIGLFVFIAIYLFSFGIYQLNNVSPEMVALGAPFLRLKALGVFFTFMTLGLLGFMRAVKNTRIPMVLNIIGIMSFIVFDYTLVLGKFGFSSYGLLGSAYATVLQQSIIFFSALSYILLNSDYKKYFSHMFFSVFRLKKSLHILNLSWPIIIDKSSVALSYTWLLGMVASFGEQSIATYDVIKNLERFAFNPAVASAAIITFLVSNSLGAQDNDGAMANIKKIYMLTFFTVAPVFLLLCFNASYCISFFDPLNKFTGFASLILPPISILIIFDFTQVFLAAALRGAGDVKTVMWTRFFACSCFFVPISWVLKHTAFTNKALQFGLIYGSFYLTTGIMGLVFFRRIQGRKWQKRKI